MIVSGEFRFMGIQESALNADKKWARAVLSQGTDFGHFYVTDDSLLKVLRNLPEAVVVSANISIRTNANGTFMNLLAINDVSNE